MRGTARSVMRIVNVLALVTVIGGIGFLGGSFLRYIEALGDTTTSPLSAVAPADAIVVLTGGPDRLEVAGDLLAARLSDRLLVSGVGARTSAEEVRELLGASRALFDCCVSLGFEARDTRGNGVESARWIAGLRSGAGEPTEAVAPDRAATTRPGIPSNLPSGGADGAMARATAQPATKVGAPALPLATGTPDAPSASGGQGDLGATPRVLVVTSNYHMRRALFELRRAAPGVEWVPHPVAGIDIAAPGWWREASTWRLLLAEHAKYLLAGARRLPVLDRMAARLLGPSPLGSGVPPGSSGSSGSEGSSGSQAPRVPGNSVRASAPGSLG